MMTQELKYCSAVPSAGRANIAGQSKNEKRHGMLPVSMQLYRDIHHSAAIGLEVHLEEDGEPLRLTINDGLDAAHACCHVGKPFFQGCQLLGAHGFGWQEVHLCPRGHQITNTYICGFDVD